MGSKLADFYENCSREALNKIKRLDYSPDFYKALPGSHYDHCVSIVEPLVRSQAEPRTLEIGVGTGALLHWLRHAGANPTGVEISETMVDALCEKGFDVHRTDLNEEPLPFPNDSFPLVISMDVIEHVICPISFMKEVYRVCAPGGHALISTANSRTIKAVYRLVVQGRFPWTCEEKHDWDCGHLHYFTSRDVALLGEEMGFGVERNVGVSIFHPGLNGTLKRALFAVLPRGFSREFIAGTFMILFRK